MSTPAARCLRTARFEFRSRNDAVAVAEYIAAFLPDGARIELILMELMLNAVEHGNLEINDAKAELVARGELEAEIARRLADPRYRDRIAWLEIARENDGVVLTVGDGGCGFKWQSPVPGDLVRPCGRGIALAREMSSSGLAFNSEGNVVIASVRW